MNRSNLNSPTEHNMIRLAAIFSVKEDPLEVFLTYDQHLHLGKALYAGGSKRMLKKGDFLNKKMCVL